MNELKPMFPKIQAVEEAGGTGTAVNLRPMIAMHDGCLGSKVWTTCLGSKVWTTSDHGTGVIAEGLPAARQEERGRCHCSGRSFSPGMRVQRIDEMR